MVTRARELVVIAGQRRGLAMAVTDWRRSERTTALDRLLSGTLTFNWRRHGVAHEPDTVEDATWDGLIEDELMA